MLTDSPQLPCRQSFHILYASSANTLTVIHFTKIIKPEMIESFDVPKDKVARWAGFTSAIFSLSQAATGIFWGRASDRFGRKPVILVGLLCVMVASLLFGFSRSLPEAIAARAFSGSVNGNVGIIRTAVAELVPQKELQARAFSIMPLVWGLGSIIGPAIGGALADPATKYPKFFGTVKLFKTYPFCLPNIFNSLFFLIGLSTGFLYLKESLATKKNQRDYGRVLGELLSRPFKAKQRQTHGYNEGHQAIALLKSRRSSLNSVTDDYFNDSLKEQVVQQAPPGYREVSFYNKTTKAAICPKR